MSAEGASGSDGSDPRSGDVRPPSKAAGPPSGVPFQVRGLVLRRDEDWTDQSEPVRIATLALEPSGTTIRVFDFDGLCPPPGTSGTFTIADDGDTLRFVRPAD